MRNHDGSRIAGPIVPVLVSGACALVCALAAVLAYRGSRSATRLEADIGCLRGKLEALSAYVAERSESEAASLELLASRLGAEIAETRASCMLSLSALTSRCEGLDKRLSRPPLGDGAIGAKSGGIRFDTDLDARVREAESAFRAKNYGEAASRYADLLAVVPDEELFLERRAISLYRANPADSAAYASIERDLKALVLRGAGGFDALKTLALVSVERGEWAQAVEIYATLLRARPDDIELAISACDCALLSGDKAVAARFLEIARRLDNGDRRLQSELSRIQALIDDDAEAPR